MRGATSPCLSPALLHRWGQSSALLFVAHDRGRRACLRYGMPLWWLAVSKQPPGQPCPHRRERRGAPSGTPCWPPPSPLTAAQRPKTRPSSAFRWSNTAAAACCNPGLCYAAICAKGLLRPPAGHPLASLATPDLRQPPPASSSCASAGAARRAPAGARRPVLGGPAGHLHLPHVGRGGAAGQVGAGAALPLNQAASKIGLRNTACMARQPSSQLDRRPRGRLHQERGRGASVPQRHHVRAWSVVQRSVTGGQGWAGPLLPLPFAKMV